MTLQEYESLLKCMDWNYQRIDQFKKWLRYSDLHTRILAAKSELGYEAERLYKSYRDKHIK